MAVQITAKSDMDGILSVHVHLAQTYGKDKKVVVGDDITKQVPEELLESLRQTFLSISKASEPSLKEWAAKAALEHLAVDMKKVQPTPEGTGRTVQLHFDGSLTGTGTTTQ